LGGDIELYVGNNNGDLTADELARIQDAVPAVNGATESYGVTVEEVSDRTLADVTLSMDNTSAVGGYADGVLGCATDVGQITIIRGWSFFAGDDPTQIGSAQYDFKTVVTHDLGHALGLGHSTDSTSVMYARLNTGTVDRALTTADFNVADNDTTGACVLHAAGSLVMADAANNRVSLLESRPLAAALPPKDAIRDFLFAEWASGSKMPRGSALVLGSGPCHTGDFAGDTIFGDRLVTNRVSALEAIYLSAKSTAILVHRRQVRSEVQPFNLSFFGDPVPNALNDDSNCVAHRDLLKSPLAHDKVDGPLWP
jgi:hypothetical protein